MSMSMSFTIFNVIQILDYYGVHESVYGVNRNVIVKCWQAFAEKNVLSR